MCASILNNTCMHHGDGLITLSYRCYSLQKVKHTNIQSAMYTFIANIL